MNVKRIYDLAKKEYDKLIEWGTGFFGSFSENEKLNLKKIINELNEPFNVETYKKYDGYEIFENIFEKYNLKTIEEQKIFFDAFKIYNKKQIIKEYYQYFDF